MWKKLSVTADICLSCFFILLGAVIIRESLDLPPGAYDPLGSASVPQAVCIAIILMSLVILVRGILMLQAPTLQKKEHSTHRTRPELAVGLFLLSLLYALSMSLRLNFAISTSIYLVCSIGLLSGFKRSLLPAMLVVGLLMGFGLRFLFTQVFVIDLP